MNLFWFWVPVLLGFAYLFWSAKDPNLDEKLSFLNPLFKLIGYCLGCGVILVLLWGVLQ